MTWQEVLFCGAVHNCPVDTGDSFAIAWAADAELNSIPPLPAQGFDTLQEACEWIAENHTGPNPCESK